MAFSIHRTFTSKLATIYFEKIDQMDMGCASAYSKSLITQQLHFDTQAEAITCQVALKNNCPPLIICSIYRSPTNNLQSVEQLCSLFNAIKTTYQDSPTWIMGDLNLSNINWESCCIAGNSYPLTLCNMMIDCMQECGFSQAINFPTRRNNILDIFFTNRPSLIRKCQPYLVLMIMKSYI